METKTIRRKIKLAFNPADSTPETQEVFKNPLARTLWLAIRPGRLVADDFSQSIIKYSEIIERELERGSLTDGQLFRILSGLAAPPKSGVIGTGEREFAKELMPFVKGEKEISYEIVKS